MLVIDADLLAGGDGLRCDEHHVLPELEAAGPWHRPHLEARIRRARVVGVDGGRAGAAVGGRGGAFN